MTLTEQIANAKSPREAIMILTSAVAALEAEVAALKSEGGGWDQPMDFDGFTPDTEALAEEPENPFEPIEVPIDEAEVARLESLLVVQGDQLEAIRRGGKPIDIQNAMMEYESTRAKLRLAKDPGKIMPVSGDQVGDPEHFFQVEGVDLSILPFQQSIELGGMVVNLPPATDAQKKARRAVAEAIDLPGFFPAVQRQSDEAREEIIDNFVKGGPLWLYMGDEFGREILMSMPDHAKRVMVNDVAVYGDVRVSHEFARDVLKDDGFGIEPGDASDYLESVVDGAAAGDGFGVTSGDKAGLN